MHHGKRSALKNSVSAITLGLAAFAAQPALANPAGGQVSSGSATISAPSSSKTVVNQSSQGVVINWKSFDIAQGQITQFIQPSAKSVAINRIGGQNASQILGTLSANGKIVLINPNGIAFGKGSKVNVGALIATTTDGTDNDLLAGKFTKAGGATGYVNNAGRINANGTVALVAPNVSNSGVVNAKIGSVSLGGTNRFTVDFNGDGLVSFAAGDASKASVSNTGRLTGANVSMTARTAEGLATGVVNTSGIVTATGVNNRGGNITLDAGKGGSISVNNATLIATGKSGGGPVTIGGWNHSSVIIDKASSIDASAILKGNGGNVSIIAATTSVKGTIDARGGKHSGSGGQIETSGHSLDFAGAKVDTGAKHGDSGNWLLDPTDLVIDAASAATISTALASGDVTLQTTALSASDSTSSAIQTGSNGDIDVEGEIVWSSSNMLTLDAYNAVNVWAPINVLGSGTLSMLGGNQTTASNSWVNVNAPITFATPGTAHLSINTVGFTFVSDIDTLIADVNALPTGHFALANDMAGGTYSDGAPIDWLQPGGFVEGLGHTIDGLSFSSTASNGQGLFNIIGGTVENLHLTNVSIPATTSNGSAALAYENDGTVFNVTSSGSVGGDGSSWVGGLVAYNAGTIDGSSSSATVSGGSYSGGLVGENANNGRITNSFATGSVSNGVFAVGGLVGLNIFVIANSYATGAVTADLADAGGLVGDNQGSVDMSYALGSVGSNAIAGGLIGSNTSGSINHTYASGAVSATTAGGLIGYDSGSTTSNSVWDAASTGQGSATAVNNSSIETGLVSVNATTRYTASAYSPLTFADLGGTHSTSWVIVDVDGTINNASGAAGAIRPMLVSEYSTSITNVHQLQLIGLEDDARYVISSDVDASATAGTGDVWGTAGFAPVSLGNGAVTGFGGAIANLTINSNAQHVGLFGFNSGAITDVLLTNPSITGGAASTYVGTLVGISAGTGTITGSGSVGGTVTSSATTLRVGGLAGSNGSTATIEGSYSSTAVHAITQGYAGGLVGLSPGDISASYATGSVTADANASFVGGLVGGANGSAAITDSFAMGNVSATGATSYAGGLIGRMLSTAQIATSYSTGMVTGTSGANIGGAIGTNAGTGAVTNVYWDTDTSGVLTDSTGATGKPTGELFSVLPTGFDSSVWGTGTNLLPYLNWMSPDATPVSIFGIAYSDRGQTAAVNASMGYSSSGSVIASSGVTGADGFYYAWLTPGVTSGIAYFTGAQHGMTYTDSLANGGSIYGGWTRLIGSAANYSTLNAGFAATEDTDSENYLAPNLEIEVLGGGSFDFDGDPGFKGNKLLISTDGTVTQSVALNVPKLVVAGTGSITLDNASNHISEVGGSTGGLTLKTANALTVDALNAGSGNISLTSTGAITVAGTVTGSAVGLMAGGTLKSKGASASIHASIFYGNSTGGLSLNGANEIDDIEGFTNTGGGNFSLNDMVDLEIGGAIDGGTGNLSLSTGGKLSVSATVSAGKNVTLGADRALTATAGISAGKTLYLGALSIDTSGATLTANILTGATSGIAYMTGANQIAQLGDFTTNGGDFDLVTAGPLSITGQVDTSGAHGTGDLTIETNGTMTIRGSLTGGEVSLTSDLGAILEKNAGAIIADLLNVSAATGYNLSGPNDIDALGTVTTTKGQHKLVQHGAI